MERVFLTGATGFQGSAIASALMAAGYHVVAPVRTEEKRGGLAQRGIQATISDYSEASLTAIASGADKAVVLVPSVIPSLQMVDFVRKTFEAIQQAAVGRVILHISSVVPDERTGIAGPDARLAMKELALQIIPGSTVTSSTLYLENFSLAYRSSIMDSGIIPRAIPADVPVSYLSMADVATYLVALLKSDFARGRFFAFGGNNAIAGDAFAGLIGRQLNKRVVYHPVEPTQLVDFLTPLLGASVANQIAEMYAWEGTQGKEKLAVDSTALQHNLGIALPGIDTWISQAFT